LFNEPPSTRTAWFILSKVEVLGGVRGALVTFYVISRLLDYKLPFFI